MRRSSLAYLYGCAAADSQPHSAASTALMALRRCDGPLRVCVAVTSSTRVRRARSTLVCSG